MGASMRPLARALLATIVSGGVLAGCGTTKTVTTRTIALRIDEYHISPESVRVYAGQLRISLHDDGILTHTLVVRSQSGSVTYAFIGTVFPGRTRRSSTFVLPPGSYRMQDATANYADLGAWGTITVVFHAAAKAARSDGR
jgi:hypothetical protein